MYWINKAAAAQQKNPPITAVMVSKTISSTEDSIILVSKTRLIIDLHACLIIMWQILWLKALKIVHIVGYFISSSVHKHVNSTRNTSVLSAPHTPEQTLSKVGD